MITEQTKRTIDFTGTVSRATMRVQDLVPSFMRILAEYDPDAFNRIQYDIVFGDDNRFTQLQASIAYSELCFNDDNLDWDHWELGYILNEDIWDAMQEIAPEGFYFGAHPGDGCDYGFWAFEEDDIW